MFLRSKLWTLGYQSTSFNNSGYVPQTVDGHMGAGFIGRRYPQIAYHNKFKDRWKYRLSLEYAIPKFTAPDSLKVKGRSLIPIIAGRLSRQFDKVKLMVAALIRPSRFQFTEGRTRAQTVYGYGATFAALSELNDRNRGMVGAVAGTGIATIIADYRFSNNDALYNPLTGDFEKIRVYAGYVALEHDWNDVLSSSITYSIVGAKNMEFQDSLALDDGYKGLLNLFYKPVKVSFLRGLVFGGEIEYAHRTNKNRSNNSATRAGLLIYYNF
jgi:hypothetical protein